MLVLEGRMELALEDHMAEIVVQQMMGLLVDMTDREAEAG